MIDFADVKLAAGVEADAGRDGLAIFLDGSEDGGGAGGELIAGPFLVESLICQKLEEEGEMSIAGAVDPVQ